MGCFYGLPSDVAMLEYRGRLERQHKVNQIGNQYKTSLSIAMMRRSHFYVEDRLELFRVAFVWSDG